MQGDHEIELESAMLLPPVLGIITFYTRYVMDGDSMFV